MTTQTKPCKHGDAACGAGYWDCGECSDEQRRISHSRLTPEQKAYDNYVDPLGFYHVDYDRISCCSCHVSAPCSYCTSQAEKCTVCNGEGVVGDEPHVCGHCNGEGTEGQVQ